MARFRRCCVDLFLRPRVALRAVLADSHRVLFGLVGLLILAVVYFLGISAALALDVAHLPQFLVLNIPAEQYYSYERFFIFPVGLAGTILASGVIRLAALLWNGAGRFEDLFALLGFSMIVVAVVIGLPDLAIAIMSGAGLVAPPGFEFVGPHVWLGTLWYMVLTVLAVQEVERLSWSKSIVLALLGFAVNGIVQFVFIR